MIVMPKRGIPYYRLGGKTPLNTTRLSVACEFCGIITPAAEYPKIQITPKLMGINLLKHLT